MAKLNMEFKSLTASDVGKLFKDGEISIRGSKAVIVTTRKVRGKTVSETIHLALQPAIVQVEVPEGDAPAPKKRAAKAPKKGPPKKRGPKPKKVDVTEAESESGAESEAKAPKKRGPKPKKKVKVKKTKKTKPAVDPESEAKVPKKPAKPKKKKGGGGPSIPWMNEEDFNEDEFEM